MKPVLQALVLADQIYQDSQSGKMVICGTFTKYLIKKQAQPGDAAENKPAGSDSLTKLPAGMAPFSAAGSPFAYLCLKDIRDSADLELRYVDLTDNSALIAVGIRVDCKDPLQVVEVRIPLPTLPCPHAGEYSLELLCEDELLGSWRVSVIEVTDTEEEQEQ